MSLLTVIADAATNPSLDTGLVDQLMGVVKSVMGLFTAFPLNIFIIAAIVGIAFRVVKQGKSAAK